MGKIDQPQDAIDHGVAKRDQRVDAADRDAEDQEVQPLGDAISALDQSPDGAPDYDDHDAEAQSPQNNIDKREARQGSEFRKPSPTRCNLAHFAPPFPFGGAAPRPKRLSGNTALSVIASDHGANHGGPPPRLVLGGLLF